MATSKSTSKNSSKSTLVALPQEKDKIVVTTGLPYANGNLHLGHLLGLIQTDIYVRFLKHIGKNAINICAEDMHGTPIMLKAKQENIEPLKYANQFFKQHQLDAQKFQIHFDNYHKTHSKENKKLSLFFFNTLKEKGLIYTKESSQLYDKKAGQFLPDRFIKGECPKCHAKEQYGDNCESCNATYEPTDLINPYSTITKTKPISKKTTNYYFKLSKCQTKLKKWLTNSNNPLQKEVKNFALNWIKEGLNDWCISRDDPYFGFEIPNSKKETGAKKYLYVWLDAPIGYISSTMNYCDKLGGSSKWQDYWQNKRSQPVHFIGKDIMYFHLLFWPAMLMEMGLEMPIINVHGFITVDGTKMSKTRGTFVNASGFHNLYGGEHLRFYFASHSNRSVTDIDLNYDQFKAVSNNVLLASLGNFFYRTLSFASKNHLKGLPIPANTKQEKTLNKQIKFLIEEIHDDYLQQNLKDATNKIIKISDLGNVYFQEAQPWKKIESTGKKELLIHQEKIASQVSFCVNLTKTLSILIKPILPTLSQKVENSLSIKPQTWQNLKDKSWQGKVKSPQKMLNKIEIKTTNTNKKSNNGPHNNSNNNNAVDFPVDIRVGKIVAVNDHPKADKLYVLNVDFGTGLKTRQIVAGLKNDYTKGQLQNKTALFIVNLEPATIRDVKSSGMSLVAEDQDKSITLLWANTNTKSKNIASLGTRATFESKETPKTKTKTKKTITLPTIDFKTWQKQKLKVISKNVLNKHGQILKLNAIKFKVNAKDNSKIM